MLAAHGAVSEEAVRAMAEGARSRFAADLAVAVSGIAGPGGGTADKPVGTVHFAWAAAGGMTAARRIFAGSRESVRRQTVALALERLVDLVWVDERALTRRRRPAPRVLRAVARRRDARGDLARDARGRARRAAAGRSPRTGCT